VAALELTRRAAMAESFVVLGASNVSRGLARLAAALRARAPGPVELFVAAGHGRGYGVNTRVAWRRLPAIRTSGLWRALDRERVARPAALVTDVGNELLYGLGVTAVATAVRDAVERLRDRGGRVAITGLPLGSIAGVGPVRYRLMRTVYVPGCQLSRAAIKDAALWLDDELRTIPGFRVRAPNRWSVLQPSNDSRSRACDAGKGVDSHDLHARSERGLHRSGADHDERIEPQVFHSYPHGAAELGPFGIFELVAQPTACGEHEQVEFGPSLRAPEICLRRTRLPQHLFEGEAFPRAAHLWMGVKLRFGLQADEMMEDSGVAEIDFRGLHLTLADVLEPGLELPDHECLAELIEVIADCLV